ncbi:hypothetical protein GGQ94_000390 [Petrimonas sulfuriphila]|nr:hypothetical protein [Petrimonas sp.]NLU30761.1 hypothetical protein [Bacteroidales bacterium]
MGKTLTGSTLPMKERLPPKRQPLFNAQMEEVTEPGEFTIMIGAASSDIRLRGSFLCP